MPEIETVGSEIHVSTDCFEAVIATEGYTSGVKGGSFLDRRTGARDLGHGLDIADFLLEPAEGKEQDGECPYHTGDGMHGNIEKRYVELPQICTKARKLPYQIFRGDGFMAAKTRYTWKSATLDYRPGSVWEQTIVFPEGQRYFFASDRITSANDCDALIFRLDMPGHLKHNAAQEFSAIYLSYEGETPGSEFLEDFAPDERHLYQRDDAVLPARMIRGYRVRTDSGNDPWLVGMTLDPADVYEAWCHQRGYVCFIQELGGRPIKTGEKFGAAYVVGYFDSVDEMNDVYDGLRGSNGIVVSGDEEDANWEWVA